MEPKFLKKATILNPFYLKGFSFHTFLILFAANCAIFFDKGKERKKPQKEWGLGVWQKM